eukprot:jgi/Picsp_1/531/NSC_00528-R1_pre-mrna-splicing factor cwc22 homolog
MCIGLKIGKTLVDGEQVVKMENGSQKLKDSDIVQTNDEKEVEAAGRGVPQSGNDDVRADKKRILLGEGRTGGAYIPPFKLARMLAEVEDRESVEYQRLTWDALRKSINGLVNKVNASNIKYILPEMFSENILRGMGLLCRSLMRSQVASPPFTPVYAALIAVINTKFPEIGELLLHRVLTAFKRSFRRNDKTICLATLKFIAHLVNQQVVHEVLAFELALLLLENPSDDSVEIASEFIKECGAMLQEVSSNGLNFVFDRLRGILHEGESMQKRTQYIIEGLFAVRKAGFEESGYPKIPAELDLVEEADQITHELTLEDKLNPQMGLDVFREDPEFKKHEEEYAAMKAEILGDSDEEEEEDLEGEESEEEEEEEEEDAGPIQDETGTDLVNLRRTIYLTIMSALDFEEAGHKLLKMGIPPGQESELATMIIECCSQEKTFVKYYALLAERFCKLKREYVDSFADCFVAQYSMIHRLETNKLRNVAKLFAYLLSTDALPWAILSVIHLTEEDTTSSSRIFIKILFQELAEILGLRELNSRLEDPTCADWFAGLFPKDSPRNMRFSINFFTSIGLGGLTDSMREFLKNLPQLLAAQRAAEEAARSSETTTDSSSGTDRSSYSTSSSGTYSSKSSSGYSTDSDSQHTSPSVSSDDNRRRDSRSPSSPPQRRSQDKSREDVPSRRRDRSRRRNSRLPSSTPPRRRSRDERRSREDVPSSSRRRTSRSPSSERVKRSRH